MAAAVSSAVVATALVPFNVYAVGKEFTDVKKGSAYYEAVAYLTGQGIVKGYADKTFKPNREITRAEAAALIASAMGLDEKTYLNPVFTDVKKGSWYFEAVAALVDEGIIQGKSNGTFHPNEPITRAEFSKIISLAYGLKGNKETSQKFKDVPPNSWYSGYVGALIDHNITTGISSTTFGADKFLTRGQMALFMYRAELVTKSIKPQVIEQVTDQNVTINGVDYKIAPALSSIFNKSNEVSLENSSIKFSEKAGVITAINYLELSNSGSLNAASIFDAKGATISGDLRVSGDYVLLKNLVIKGDFEIVSTVQNKVTADRVVVEGKTTISSDNARIASLDKFYKSLSKRVTVDEVQTAAVNPTINVLLENSTFTSFDLNRDGVSVEVIGNTKLQEVNISSNSSLSVNPGASINKVNLHEGATVVGLSGSINELNIYNNDNVVVRGNVQIDKLYVQQNSNNRIIDLDIEGRINHLEVNDKNAKVRLKSGVSVANIVIPEGSNPGDIIQNYDSVKRFIEKINGVTNPDFIPVISAPYEEPGLREAITAANTVVTDTKRAKTAYIEAYGLGSDSTYVAVEKAEVELKEALNASSKVKANIESATVKLTAAVKVLDKETKTLIEDMKETLASANKELESATHAKTDYIAAYGLKENKSYVAVETAEAILKVVLDAPFKLKADIDSASTNLTNAVSMLEAETAVLITEMNEAIHAANLVIDGAELAKTDYSAAFGLSTDDVYVAVETAEVALQNAINATLKVKVDIEAATISLADAVSALKSQTEVFITKMNEAIVTANAARELAAEAKANYTGAYGYETDSLYVAVENAETELAAALNASFKVRADIERATATLTTSVKALKSQTEVLITEMNHAIESANTASEYAAEAKSSYKGAYGYETDSVYVAVQNAEAELLSAVNASFKVKADIENATSNLTEAITTLNAQTEVLISEMNQAIESANTANELAAEAKFSYKDAYGYKTDSVYVAVETAEAELAEALNATFKVRATIETATANLTYAVTALETETEILIKDMNEALHAANDAFENAKQAKEGYLAAYGLPTDAAYVTVGNAEAQLQKAISASFKVKEKIKHATENLSEAVTALKSQTEVLISEMNQAIESANMARELAEEAKSNYTGAYGYETDSVYVAVESAESKLAMALNASFKVRADIENATANLTDAVSALKSQTDVLITEMNEAIESANTANELAAEAKSNYKNAYGYEADLEYVVVETAEAELADALNASFKVKADIENATANLNAAVTTLNTQTEVLITEMNEAIQSASEAFESAEQAKTGYSNAFGLLTDEVYVAVETAEAELQSAVNASFKVKANIENATANLIEVVTALKAQTEVLITEMNQAIESANKASELAAEAKSSYKDAFGYETDLEFVAVAIAEAELATALNESFKIRTDIENATANLNDAVTALKSKTEVLIMEMNEAIQTASTAIESAQQAKAGYSAAYGYSTDDVYVAVESAEAELVVALNASFKVKADIESATTKLSEAILLMKDETTTLITEMNQAIKSANTAREYAADAKVSYMEAYGYKTDSVYVAVKTAETVLAVALNASFKVRADIEGATTNLINAVSAMEAETEVLISEMDEAILAANIALESSELAKLGYTNAYGYETNSVYEAVQTAEEELQSAVNVSFKVKADIENATANLSAAVTALKSQTEVLITEMNQAIESANTASDLAAEAKINYMEAYGYKTDSVYVAVKTAETELAVALNATFKVRTDIESATANLNEAVATLKSQTEVLILEMNEAIQVANEVIESADQARESYSAAYGLSTDKVYADVEKAEADLKTVLNASFKLKTAIEKATVNLSNAVSVLESQTEVLITEMQIAIDSANSASENAVVARNAYTNAFGHETDSVYGAVVTAEADLQVALDATFKVKLDIEAATTNLSNAVSALEAQTEVLITEMQVAIDSADSAKSDAILAKTAYTDAFGLATDEAYVAVETAEAQLQDALDETFKVRADIDSATSNLTATVLALKEETETMIEEMQQAVTAANSAIATVAEAKADYMDAYGSVSDSVFVAVEATEEELQTVLNATFKVKVDIERATTALTNAVSALEVQTEVLITEMVAAIQAANATIESAEEAQTAFTDVSGSTTDDIYVAVDTAIVELQAAMDAEPKVTSEIEIATANLATAVLALGGETERLNAELQQAVDSAATVIMEANLALSAYRNANGSTTDASYVAVETNLELLETTLDSTQKDDIEAATANLASAIATLKVETNRLIAEIQVAVEAANVALASAEQAKTDYLAANGSETNEAFIAVETNVTAVEAALGNSIQVKSEIEAATTNLLDAVSTLAVETALQQSIEAANTALASAEQAKTDFIEATGSESDAAYVDVEASIVALEEALAENIKIVADIDDATASLTNAVSALNTKTESLNAEWQSVIDAANSAIASAEQAKTAYTDVEGLTTDAIYMAVEDSLTALETSLSATPRVKEDIESATATLVNAVTALESATSGYNTDLQAAINAANAEITNAEQVKTDYLADSGTETDAEYEAVESSIAVLEEVLSASPKVKADILAASSELHIAVQVLETILAKSDLEQEITEATAILAAAEVGTDEGQYSQASVDVLTVAIGNAQSVYDQTDATLDEVKVAITSLIGALETFKQSAVIPFTLELQPGAQLTINSTTFETVTIFSNPSFFNKRNIKDLIQVKRGNEVQNLVYNQTSHLFDVKNSSGIVTGEISLSSTTELLAVNGDSLGVNLQPQPGFTESTSAGLIFTLNVLGEEVSTQTLDITVVGATPNINGAYSEDQLILTTNEEISTELSANFAIEFSSNGEFTDSVFLNQFSDFIVNPTTRNKRSFDLTEKGRSKINIQSGSKFRIKINGIAGNAKKYVNEQVIEVVVD